MKYGHFLLRGARFEVGRSVVVEQVVEPDEVRLEIRKRFEVVHVVFQRSPVERNPVVWSERKRVTAVLVDAQEVQEDHE